MPRVALVSAALRHVRDAQHLAQPGPNRSLDQALHIAGFGPECIRKACLDDRLFDKALGHEIRDVTDAIVAFLVAYDPEANRYGIDDHAAGLPFRARYWRPDVRYVRTGYVAQTLHDGERELSALLDEARAFVDQRVCELFCDGMITGEALS